MQIDLYEDNGGFLHLTNGSRVWVWTEAPGQGDFDRDALVMSAGDDGDWLDNFGPIDAEDRPTTVPSDALLVASWTPERGRWLAGGDVPANAATYLARSNETLEAIAAAAWALLYRIEHMTTKEFSIAGEKAEREALAEALGLGHER